MSTPAVTKPKAARRTVKPVIPFWEVGGYTFALQPVWPPQFESCLPPPTPRQASFAAISKAQRANRVARVAAGGDRLEPPVTNRKPVAPA